MYLKKKETKTNEKKIYPVLQHFLIKMFNYLLVIQEFDQC